MRLPDWQSRLSAVLKAHAGQPFEWGVNDCCLFVCDCLVAVAGIDPAAEFRGRYADESRARALVLAYCGGDIERLCETMAERHGFLEIAPVYAQRGDFGLYRSPALGPTLGICAGALFLFVGLHGYAGTVGMLPVASGEISRAWRIG